MSLFSHAFLGLILISTPTVAQHTAKSGSGKPATPVAAPAGMTNDDVIALASAGLGDGVIIAKIKSAPATSFDTSVAGLKALKAANVSNAVIAVVVDPKAPVAAPVAAPITAAATPAAPAPGNPDDPASAHAPGIYMLAQGPDGHTHMTLLERITPKEHKAGGFWASSATYGLVKAHGKAVLDGPKASVETTDPKPVFYLYIPDASAGSFGGSYYNPKDFAMVKFDVKASSREIVTGSYSMWGSSSGTDEKSRQGFTSESVKPGVYKLTPIVDLHPGEYAFEQGWGTYFDFGVSGPTPSAGQ